MSALLTWLAMWLLPSLLIFAWIKADEWLACDPEADVEPDYAANVVAFDRMGVTR